MAEVGDRVRARLLADSRATPHAGHRADLFTVPAFISAQHCRTLVAAIERHAVPSTLYSDSGAAAGIRTSSTHYFRDDPAADRLAADIDALLGLDRAFAEPMQGQRYRAGEEYRHHSDFLRTRRDHWMRERERGGQRTWTAMLYLNAMAAGGSTDFRRLGLQFQPEPGLLVVWNNMDRSGRPNSHLLHAGMPVTDGTKYIITQWYRLHPWQPTRDRVARAD